MSETNWILQREAQKFLLKHHLKHENVCVKLWINQHFITFLCDKSDLDLHDYLKACNFWFLYWIVQE